MYNKNFFPLTIQLLIIIFKIKKISSILDCSTLTDCFNCSVCGTEELTCDCKWNSIEKKCQSSTQIKNIYDWKLYFSNCEDSFSINKQNTYCGDINIMNKKFLIELPKVNGYYGLLNLYCIYTYNNNYNSATIFDFDIETSFRTLYIDFAIYFNDGTYSYFSLKNGIAKKEYNDVKYIQFYIYLGETYSISPFLIKVSIKQFSKFILYVIVFIILFACISCIFLIYCFTKRYKRESNYINNYNANLGFRRNVNDFNNLYNEELERRIKKKTIEVLLSDPNYLGIKVCKKEYEKYGNNCTICLEEFKIGIDKISLTPCYHIFHYKCLSSYMRKNENNTHCPNCNQDLINSWNKKIENINPENIQIQRNNNENIIINSTRRSNRIGSRRRQNVENNNANIRRDESNNFNTNEILSLGSRRNLEIRNNANNRLVINNNQHDDDNYNNTRNVNSNNLEVENI
jgi:hypothetical protein